MVLSPMPIRIALIFSLLLLTGAAATQPAATESSDPVAVLIGQLDAPEFGVRELAEKRLSDMGPAVEPRLRLALDQNPSDESRTRLNDVLARLDEAKAMHASVTMHYANTPVTKILADFAAQAGGDLGIGDPSVATFVDGRVASVDLDNAGFWQALRVVSDASGLSPSIGQSGLTLAPEIGRAIMQIDFASPYAQTAGGLFIVPQSGQEIRMIRYQGNQRQGFITLVINVVPEPRLHVLGAVGFDWARECVDDKGNSLIMPAVANQRFMRRGFMMSAQGPRQPFWSLSANLREFPGMGTKIARLRGELDCTVQTHAQTFEFDDVTRAAGQTKSDGQVDVTIKSCSRMGLNYRLDMAFIGIGINMGTSSVQDCINSVQLVDDHGQIIERQSAIPQLRVNAAHGVPDTQNLTIIFQPTQNTPATLRWERTLEQKRLSVPFELDDLPLP
jgi:hypothetical protein